MSVGTFLVRTKSLCMTPIPKTDAKNVKSCGVVSAVALRVEAGFWSCTEFLVNNGRKVSATH